jgi:hypothetical protein
MQMVLKRVLFRKGHTATQIKLYNREYQTTTTARLTAENLSVAVVF